MNNKVYIFKPTHPHLLFIYNEYVSSAADKRADALSLWRTQKYQDAYTAEYDIVTELLGESHDICFGKDYVNFMRDYHCALFPYTSYSPIFENYMVEQNPARKNDPEEWECLSDEQRGIISDWHRQHNRLLREQHQKEIEDCEEKTEKIWRNSTAIACIGLASYYELLLYNDAGFLQFVGDVAVRGFLFWALAVVSASFYKQFDIGTSDSRLGSAFKHIGSAVLMIIFVGVLYSLLN